MYEADFRVIIDYLPFIKKGILLTVYISLSASVFAFIIGLTSAFFKNTGNAFLKFITSAWVEITRNIPLLIQIYFFYKGLPAAGIKLPPIICGIAALSLYTGAYISEVFISGINSIAKEQIQAAKALGLTNFQTFRLIIFPQAVRIVIPLLGNQFINLVKNSSLVSFIAVTDIFYVIYKGAVDDFRVIEFFVFGVVVYMMLSGILALISNIAEKSFRIRGRVLVHD